MAIALGVVERSAAVLAASLVGAGRFALGSGVALTVTAAFALRRLLRGSLRVAFEVGLYGAASRALLEGEVLRARPTGEDPQAVLFEGTYLGARFGETFPQVIADAVASTGIAVALLATQQSRPLMVSCLAAGCVALGGALGARRATAALQKRLQAAHDPVLQSLLAIIHGRLELVARGREEHAVRCVHTALEEYRRAALEVDRIGTLVARAPLALGLAAGGAVFVATNGLHLSLSTSELGPALVLASALPAFAGVATGVQELARLSTAFEPMARLLTAPRRPELARPRDPHRPGARPALPARVAWEAVTFAYDPASPPALDAVEVVWEPGRILALTGRNGAGKSTLLRLLVALATPQRGRITVGGVDLREIDPAWLRSHIVYLPQRPYLGEAATVREAIQLLEPDAADAAIEASLARVALLDALRARAKGGNPLGVRVTELSAGQRQRVALARALLHDAPVLLLDEPDADLDAQGVTLVASLVRELGQTKMVALAAHAPELVAAADLKVTL